ncbi:MAG: transglycosylase SLT domain-containing protein [Paludibacteraceae bacterium]|nr:transglycosylase SLT domain-containing protein [Paludibacteraceae bacterium]
MRKALLILLCVCAGSRFVRGENMDSLYKQRLQYLPYEIEMPYNPVVGTYIQRYLKNYQLTARLLARADYYFPLFWDVLGKYNLPYELCYLPVIESALNPTARSHMGAAGLWQFMPATGKLYGLEVNSLVDERMDPFCSTDAACRFLQRLFEDFHDWNLVIAAYNCGPGNVKKAIARSGGKTDFWSIYPFLPHETRSYLPIYIAACYVMNYADLHDICPDTASSYPQTDTLVITERLHLNQVADILGIGLDTLRRLNPQYPRDILPGNKGYALCLPAELVTNYIEQQDTIFRHRADELVNNRRDEIEMLHRQGPAGGYSVNGVTYYKVKKGDTLSGIGKKFHVSVKQLKAWNGLKSDNLSIGKTLRIGK